MTIWRNLFSILLAAVLAGLSGCSLLHELKPHRLWRLNQASSPMSGGSSAYYSVPEQPRLPESPASAESVPAAIDCRAD